MNALATTAGTPTAKQDKPAKPGNLSADYSGVWPALVEADENEAMAMVKEVTAKAAAFLMGA